MSFPKDDNELDKELAEAFAQPPEADFSAWRQQHSQAVAYLNPQRINAIARKRRIMNRIIIFSTAVALLACAWLGLSSFSTNGTSASAFAQVLEQIQKAKSITWKMNFYEHITSEDGKSTWAKTHVLECAYKAPGLYRFVWVDDNGQVKSVEIEDWIHGRKLKYYPQEKKATIKETTPVSHDSGPFAYELEKLKQNAPDMKWVGKRKTATGEVNVFRWVFITDTYDGNTRDWSIDYWIDAKTKRLVAQYAPGADIYDPEKDPAYNNPPGKDPGKAGSHRKMGRGILDIRYDVELDDSLFRTEPPEGYAVEIKQRDRITEKEMVK
ncbi:MAG TPA: hypothetical protein VIH42_01325 [Thermoguttaceae bacterium]